MAFTKRDIDKLAALARIELTKEEQEKFGKQISSILDYVKQIQEVDTSKVKEFSHLLDKKNVFRNDKKEEYGEVKKIINQFPATAGHLNKTKAVLE